MKTDSPFALALHLPLTEGQVKLIEADLIQILGCEGAKMGTCLVAQSAYLRLLTRFLNEARGELEVDLDADPAAHESFLVKFRSSMEGGAGGRPWNRLLQIAEKEAPAERLRRALLGTVLTAANPASRQQGVLKRYFLFTLGRGQIDFGNSLGRASYRRLAEVPLDADNGEVRQRLDRYFRETLAGESLLAYEDVRFSHGMLLIGYGLCQWATAASTLHRGRSAPELEDWEAGLAYADHAVGAGSGFPARLAEDATLKTILDALMARPLFPFAMVQA